MAPNDVLMQLRDGFCERNGRVLFSDVHLQLAKGDVFHIEGPNGSGKTTLLRSIVGLFCQVQGDIKWFLPSGVDSSASMVSYWGHRLAMNSELSLVENLRWSVGLRRTVSVLECEQALATVGLKGFGEVVLGTLSAGQTQRVGLARLGLERMPVWVVDEPLNALDTDGIRFFEERVAAHAHQGGCVLMTSHQPLAIATLKTLTLTVKGLIDSTTGARYQWS